MRGLSTPTPGQTRHFPEQSLILPGRESTGLGGSWALSAPQEYKEQVRVCPVFPDPEAAHREPKELLMCGAAFIYSTWPWSLEHQLILFVLSLRAEMTYRAKFWTRQPLQRNADVCN